MESRIIAFLIGIIFQLVIKCFYKLVYPLFVEVCVDFVSISEYEIPIYLYANIEIPKANWITEWRINFSIVGSSMTFTIISIQNCHSLPWFLPILTFFPYVEWSDEWNETWTHIVPLLEESKRFDLVACRYYVMRESHAVIMATKEVLTRLNLTDRSWTPESCTNH